MFLKINLEIMERTQTIWTGIMYFQMNAVVIK